MEAFTALSNGNSSGSISSLLGKLSSHASEISPSFLLQRLGKVFPQLQSVVDAAERKQNAPASPLPQILGSSLRSGPRSATDAPAAKTQISLTNAVLAAIFTAYKLPVNTTTAALRSALSTIEAFTTITEANTTSCNTFLLAQVIHLILTDIITAHGKKYQQITTSTTSTSSHMTLRLDEDYCAIEGKIVSCIRTFSSHLSSDEIIITLLNALLRLQIITSNYLLAFRSLLNYHVSSANTSQPQLIRFYFYSSLIVAIAGQHKKALKLIISANQLFTEYFAGIKHKTQFTTDLTAYSNLFKLLMCNDTAFSEAFQQCEEMAFKVSFPDVYAVLLNKRTKQGKAHIAYLGKIFRQISLSEICQRTSLSETEAREYIVELVMDDVFNAHFTKNDNDEWIVTILGKQEQLLSNKASFREEALQLVGRLSAIREDFTRKDVQLSRANKKQDGLYDTKLNFKMQEYLDLDFSDSD